MSSPWNPPDVGEIVWCHFPELPSVDPRPKPGPALVVQVTIRDDGVIVSVVYGTSKRVDGLKSGEFAIRKTHDPAAFTLAGASFNTKFDFNQIVDLPWSETFFKIPPRAAHGQRPRLGILHASMMRSARAAYLAATRN